MRKDLPLVQVLSRHDCCLCDAAKDVVKQAVEVGMCEWEDIDVDKDSKLSAEYGMDIPVILINGRKAFKHSLSKSALQLRLSREPQGRRSVC